MATLTRTNSTKTESSTSKKPIEAIFEEKIWFWLAIIGGVAGLTRTLTFGFGFDQGLLQYSAWAALHGRWPITDTWDTTFPGGILIHMLVIGLGGTSPLAFRAFDLIVQLLNVLLLFNVTKKLTTARAGFLAVLLYVTLYGSAGHYQTAERDSFVVPLLLVAIWGFWQYLEVLKIRWIILAGTSFGLICLIRPTYFLMVAVLLGFLLLLKYGYKKPLRWTEILVAGLLCGLPTLVFLGVYILRGDFPVLVELFSYISTVYPSLERASSLEVISSLLKYAGIYLLVGLILGLVQIGIKPRNTKNLERYGLLAAALLTTILIRLLESKVYLYQFWPVLALIAIFAGGGLDFGLARLVRLPVFSQKWSKVVGLLFTGFLAVAVLISGKNLLKDYQEFWPKIQKNFGATPFYQNLVADDSEQASLAEYLHNQTQPSDYIQLWGPEMTVYYAADRFAASRYVNITALLCSEDGKLKFFADCNQSKTIPAQNTWKQTYLADILKNRPRYIVAHYEAGSLAIQRSFAFAPDFPELRALIDSDYYPVKTFGSWSVFQLKVKQVGNFEKERNLELF